jgi:hypothetical protein
MSGEYGPSNSKNVRHSDNPPKQNGDWHWKGSMGFDFQSP